MDVVVAFVGVLLFIKAKCRESGFLFVIQNLMNFLADL
jgi:hypothetical protein